MHFASDLVAASGGAFDRDTLLARERALLNALSFRVGVPTVWTFVQHFLARAGARESSPPGRVAAYLAEATLLSSDCVRMRPSELAAAAVAVALRSASSSSDGGRGGGAGGGAGADCGAADRVAGASGCSPVALAAAEDALCALIAREQRVDVRGAPATPGPGAVTPTGAITLSAYRDKWARTPVPSLRLLFAPPSSPGDLGGTGL